MDLFEAEIMAKELIGEYVPHYRLAWINHKRTNGRCDYTCKLIELSKPLTKLRTREAVRQTIMHEIAHALTPGASHGRLWQNQMAKFGYSGERCSKDQPDMSTIANWIATCNGCSKHYYMIRKPRVGKACRKCYTGRGRIGVLTFGPNPFKTS